MDIYFYRTVYLFYIKAIILVIISYLKNFNYAAFFSANDNSSWSNVWHGLLFETANFFSLFKSFGSILNAINCFGLSEFRRPNCLAFDNSFYLSCKFIIMNAIVFYFCNDIVFLFWHYLWSYTMSFYFLLKNITYCIINKWDTQTLLIIHIQFYHLT